ncbi:ferritin-like domain-containing protein [Xylogone sp. PMI_703]|nr:ferritin-like domain-containing protein [Xylogone sp. PMI_703]
MYLLSIKLLVLAGVLSGAAATVLKRQQQSNITAYNFTRTEYGNLSEANLLQYALTWEHLQVALYDKGLAVFNSSPNARNMTQSYNQLQYIARDERIHVQLLEQGITSLGHHPVSPCRYNFTVNSTQQFLQLASQLEGVGVSGLIGAARSMNNSQYLIAAAALLATEASHQSILRNSIGEVPSANPFGTPLGPNATYSIARRYIESCPPNNTALPLTVYPQLAVLTSNTTLNTTRVNQTIVLTPENGCAALNGSVYATYLSGLQIIPIPATGDRNNHTVRATVPPAASGQSYVFLTRDNSGNVTDSTVIAGPAIIEAVPSPPTVNPSSHAVGIRGYPFSKPRFRG